MIAIEDFEKLCKKKSFGYLTPEEENQFKSVESVIEDCMKTEKPLPETYATYLKCIYMVIDKYPEQSAIEAVFAAMHQGSQSRTLA